MKAVALTLAFLLELVAFAAFAGLGFVIASNGILKIVLANILLVILVIFWSLYMAPRAVKKFKPVPYYVAKLVIYAIAAYVIFKLSTPTKMYIFIALAILDDVVLYKHNLAEHGA